VLGVLGQSLVVCECRLALWFCSGWAVGTHQYPRGIISVYSLDLLRSVFSVCCVVRVLVLRLLVDGPC